MSKKAAEVVEAAPKFKQPWQGFLSFMSVFIIAYVTYQWFLHPVWGIATRMINGNVFVAFIVGTYYGAPTLGLQLAISNAIDMALYPMGYLADWSSFFVFSLVWMIAFLVLCNPFRPMKQPWYGIFLVGMSLIFGFLTWWILAYKLGWTAYDMLVLGTVGFLIFPVWQTLFGYWPFVPKRVGVPPYIRGAIYIIVSWTIVFLIRALVMKMIWGNPFGTYFSQYLLGNPTMPISAEPYNYWTSLTLSPIVGFGILATLNLFSNMKQPMRGIILFILGIILGVIMWFIIVAVIGKSYTAMPFPVDATNTILLTIPYTEHGMFGVYLAFPFVTLLFGQLTFGMWPWSRYGKWAGLLLVVVSFVVGTILYYIMMVNPGYANAVMGTNLIPSMSGMQTLYLFFLANKEYLLYVVFAVFFEGTATLVGHTAMFAWLLVVVIFFILAYEGFDHWPWK